MLKYWCPDFHREFILETDASLTELSSILLQQGKGEKLIFIAYTSFS